MQHLVDRGRYSIFSKPLTVAVSAGSTSGSPKAVNSRGLSGFTKRVNREMISCSSVSTWMECASINLDMGPTSLTMRQYSLPSDEACALAAVRRHSRDRPQEWSERLAALETAKDSYISNCACSRWLSYHALLLSAFTDVLQPAENMSVKVDPTPSCPTRRLRLPSDDSESLHKYGPLAPVSPSHPRL